MIDTRDPRARNTDGVDPASATNVTITHSYFNTGDDDVAIKAGNTGGSSNITISHNHFYRGHGVSIGSETDGGAHAIRVFDLSIDGADNGLRIKSNASRGGLVQDVEYKDVCIRNTKNVIEMDTHYSASPQTTGTLIPDFRDIRLKGVRVVDGGQVILEGYDAARPLRMSWDDVVFDHPESIKLRAANAAIAKGPGPSNLPLTGDERAATGSTSDAPRLDCERKFVPFPGTRAGNSARRGRLCRHRRREIHRRGRRHGRRNADVSVDWRRAHGSARERRVARRRLRSQRPLSREAHRRPAARHAPRRVARWSGAHVRCRGRHAARRRAERTARAAASRCASSRRIFARRT